MSNHIHLGKWTEELLGLLIEEASLINDPGERIGFLSRYFLKIKYKESTLIGSEHDPEVFVLNLEEVDCLTFIEYVEAMRRAASFAAFKENLMKVRYQAGEIAFESRNHFFTDWKAFNSDFIIDVTKSLGAEKTKDVSKRLNEKHDGALLLTGIDCRLREVSYIQSKYVDETVLGNLRTGDYIGIYAKPDGLDVSHVGIVIKGRDAVHLRHASSSKKHRKVVDEDLKDYLTAKPGIIVLRPRD